MPRAGAWPPGRTPPARTRGPPPPSAESSGPLHQPSEVSSVHSSSSVVVVEGGVIGGGSLGLHFGVGSVVSAATADFPTTKPGAAVRAAGGS